jgi:hypothetical protein
VVARSSFAAAFFGQSLTRCPGSWQQKHFFGLEEVTVEVPTFVSSVVDEYEAAS